MDEYSIFSKKELAEIYNNLNRWKWDERLGPKPYLFDEKPKSRRQSPNWNKQSDIDPIMTDIRQRISERSILKHLHLKILRRSRLQFEWYWLKRLYRVYILKDVI